MNRSKNIGCFLLKKVLDVVFSFLFIFSFFNCDNEKPFEEVNPEVIEPNLCDSVGVIKQNLYAEVWNSTGLGNEWQVRIGDSARIAEFYGEWVLFPCKNLPDTLKKDGLELIISYSDKSRVLKDKGLVRSAELLTIKRIKDFPDEDPRNEENMATFLIENVNPYDTIKDSSFVFRSESDWNKFLASRPWATPSRKIDFKKYTLIGQRVVHGGCGWIFKRSFDLIAPHQYVYKVSAEIYGGCQVGIVKYHWVTVPKILAEDTVIFKFEPSFHPWPS